MWDWKQLEWMKLLGWGLEERGKSGFSLGFKGFVSFWVLPLVVTGQFIGLSLHLKNRDFKNTVLSVSELTTSSFTIFMAFKWAYRCSDIKIIIKGIEDLDNRRKRYFSDDNHTDAIMEARTNVCSWYPYLFILSVLAGAHWPVRSFSSLFQGEYVNMINDWVPWDDKQFTGWFAHLILSAMACVSAVSSMVAYETLTLSFNDMIIGLVESISYGLSSLNFKEDVHRRLRELIDMHKDALKITAKVAHFTNFVIQTECLIFALRMCCVILELTRDWTSTTKKINTVELIIVCATFFYLQCHKCETVKSTFLNVGFAAYSCDWYRGPVEDKRSLAIILLASMKPIRFGNIINVELSSFLAVMKTTYSYYNALQALA